MVVASTLASAARGYRIGCVEAFRTLALESGGTPDATLWFNGTKVPAAAAAGVNNASSDAPGMDDTCLLLIGHFGGPSTAAALATWEYLARNTVSVPANQVLKAIVLGYEVGSRLDLALTPGRMDQGFHSRVTTVQSAVVAAGLVLGLTEEQMVHAMALATSDAGGMAIGADHASDHRPYHAHQSAFEGTRLARLAQLGVTGRPDVMEAPRGYFSAFGGQEISDITKDLGERWNFVDYMALKLIPGAHPFHVFAEAATAAVLENDIDLDAVASVIISGEQLTGVQMKDWIDIRHPRNLSDAAHSIVYFVAAAVADAKSGGFTWEHMDAVKMADPPHRQAAGSRRGRPQPAAAHQPSLRPPRRGAGLHRDEVCRGLHEARAAPEWLGARRSVAGGAGEVSAAGGQRGHARRPGGGDSPQDRELRRPGESVRTDGAAPTSCRQVGHPPAGLTRIVRGTGGLRHHSGRPFGIMAAPTARATAQGSP